MLGNTFSKGRTPWNKGTNGLSRPNKGSFTKGMKQSPDIRRKIAASRRGHIVSEETRRKIGQANKGRKPSQSAIDGARKYFLDHPERNFPRGDQNPSWKDGRAVDARLYRKSRQHLYTFYQKRRAARLKNAEGTHTFAEWETLKAQYNWKCPCCGRSEPTIKLTQDHIIPLIRGGSDNIENIQPLCQSCNSIKGTTTKQYER
jgi:5-methylcytosine-specific restriction endonuclease McrA